MKKLLIIVLAMFLFGCDADPETHLFERTDIHTQITTPYLDQLQQRNIDIIKARCLGYADGSKKLALQYFVRTVPYSVIVPITKCATVGDKVLINIYGKSGTDTMLVYTDKYYKLDMVSSLIDAVLADHQSETL